MECAWIITLAWITSGGAPAHATRSGICAMPPGTTRNDAYVDILTIVRSEFGPAAAQASTMFFSLEPNQLTPPPSDGIMRSPAQPGER